MFRKLTIIWYERARKKIEICWRKI